MRGWCLSVGSPCESYSSRPAKPPPVEVEHVSTFPDAMRRFDQPQLRRSNGDDACRVALLEIQAKNRPGIFYTQSNHGRQYWAKLLIELARVLCLSRSNTPWVPLLALPFIVIAETNVVIWPCHTESPQHYRWDGISGLVSCLLPPQMCSKAAPNKPREVLARFLLQKDCRIDKSLLEIAMCRQRRFRKPRDPLLLKSDV